MENNVIVKTSGLSTDEEAGVYMMLRTASNLEVYRKEIGDILTGMIREYKETRRTKTMGFRDFLKLLVNAIRKAYARHGVEVVSVEGYTLNRWRGGFTIEVTYVLGNGEKHVAWITYQNGHITPESVYRIHPPS